MRDERINLGAVVLHDDHLDIRITKRLEKLRAISSAVSAESLSNLTASLIEIDSTIRKLGVTSSSERLKKLEGFGPFQFSEIGCFVAPNADDYENRLRSIFIAMIEPEMTVKKPKAKRSRLLTQMKSMFRKERVLATKDDDISSHRIIVGLELAEGLTADLALKNGAMHVVETVDISSDDSSVKRAIQEIAVSALTLEQARMVYVDPNTSTRLVYDASASLEKMAFASLETAAHQGAKLVNWASHADRFEFMENMISMAEPTEKARRSSQGHVVLGRRQARLFN
jgi:hypothetical protein